MSEFDKTSIVLKLKAARARKRVENGRCEGVKPYGSLPGEDEVISRMRQLRRKPLGKSSRMSFAKIAEALEADGVPTRGGKPWAASTVKQILNRKSKP